MHVEGNTIWMHYRKREDRKPENKQIKVNKEAAAEDIKYNTNKTQKYSSEKHKR